MNDKKFKAMLEDSFGAEYDAVWEAVFEALYLFGDVAREVAAKLEFTYDEAEEKGIENYMKQVKDGLLKYE